MTAGHVLLVGMMGVGKTTIGRLLAHHLGLPHLDSDAQVQATTGRSVPEILESDGEAAFRVEEAAALRSAVENATAHVVSVAGGAVLDAGSREMLGRSGTVVWLRAATSTLAARVGDGTGRPLLAGDPEGNLRRLDSARRPLYEAMADVVVDVDDLTPAEVVARVADALEAR